MGPPSLLHVGHGKSPDEVKFKESGVNSTSLQEELWRPVAQDVDLGRGERSFPCLPSMHLVKVLCQVF